MQKGTMHLMRLHTREIANSRVLIRVVVSIIMCAFVSVPIMLQSYYAEKWDATLYNMSDYPRTIALRVAVEDAETHLPLYCVELTIEGESGRDDIEKVQRITAAGIARVCRNSLAFRVDHSLAWRL